MRKQFIVQGYHSRHCMNRENMCLKSSLLQTLEILRFCRNLNIWCSVTQISLTLASANSEMYKRCQFYRSSGVYDEIQQMRKCSGSEFEATKRPFLSCED